MLKYRNLAISNDFVTNISPSIIKNPINILLIILNFTIIAPVKMKTESGKSEERPTGIYLVHQQSPNQIQSPLKPKTLPNHSGFSLIKSETNPNLNGLTSARVKKSFTVKFWLDMKPRKNISRRKTMNRVMILRLGVRRNGGMAN